MSYIYIVIIRFELRFEQFRKRFIVINYKDVRYMPHMPPITEHADDVQLLRRSKMG